MFYACTDTEPDVKAEVNQALELRDPTLPSSPIGNTCINEKIKDSPCFTGTLVENLSFLEYPGCTFNISIEYAFCTSLQNPSVVTSVWLGEFTVNEHNCEAYEESLQEAISFGSLGQFSEDFNHMVWRKFEQNFLAVLNPNTVGLIAVHGVVRGCVNTCYLPDPNNQLNSPQDIPCGGTVCCVVTRNWLRQSTGEVVLLNSTKEENQLDCGDPNIVVSCGPGATSSTGCRPNCFPLN